MFIYLLQHLILFLAQTSQVSIQQNYRNNPFHNFRHCFCVTQMVSDVLSIKCYLKFFSLHLNHGQEFCNDRGLSHCVYETY